MMRPIEEENNMADYYMNLVANLAMNQKEILPTLLEQMKQMQETMMQMQQQLKDKPPPKNRRQITRRNVSKYCWSHGACSHTSATCNNKKDGHKNDATFEDKKGGSTYYCT